MGDLISFMSSALEVPGEFTSSSFCHLLHASLQTLQVMNHLRIFRGTSLL